MYLLNINVRKENAHVAKSSNEGVRLWHQRLGHLNMESFKKLEKMVNGMNLKEMPLHHVCGLMKTTSHGEAQYFDTFINNLSRKIHVNFLKVKGEVFDKFKACKALVENVLKIMM